MSTVAEKKEIIKVSETSLSISKQCELLSMCRGSFYYKPVGESQENLQIMRELDEQYLRTPFYGLPRLQNLLLEKGYRVNDKRLRRLMKLQGWQTLYPTPRTTRIDPAAYKYPYLLKGLSINRNNQVWAIDITYIPMAKGFMYLCAIIDLHTRYVVHWGISNAMTAEWCTGIFEEAVVHNGKPEIINSDQGSQFTSQVWVDAVNKAESLISMDGKGRAVDNIFIERLWRSVKYENIYLNVYEDGLSLYQGLHTYFSFYNDERGHQSLGYKKPLQLYKKAA